MQTDLVPSLALVLRSEGGFSNNPQDPGGATNFGITQRTYDAYRAAKGLAPAGVKFIVMADVVAIYRFQYWDHIRGDDLPPGVDYAIFDEAVNSGPVQSIKDLQAALGVKVDGHLGLMTLTALGAVKSHAALVNKICDVRLGFLHRLKNWRWFGKGWTNRVASVREASLRMAKAPVPPRNLGPSTSSADGTTTLKPSVSVVLPA